MEDADVPVECSKGEWGEGQEEINLRYAEALEMADRAALFKHGVKEIADQHGRAVTFMAKYDMGAAGSSFHLHSSLWDRAGATPLFADGRDVAAVRRLAGGPARGGPRAGPLLRALGQRLQALPGGLVRAHAHRGRRRQSHLRLPALRRGRELRVENRIPGADANPYLAFAATIAAGPHGVRSKLKAPKLYTGNAYEDATLPQVPKTLREAFAALESSADRGGGLRDRRGRALPARRAPRAAGLRRRGDGLGLIRNFERI